MSPETRSLNGGYMVYIDKLVELLLNIKDIEGITISGGEPFLQIESLYLLLQRNKKTV